jgi:hypothetical protein
MARYSGVGAITLLLAVAACDDSPMAPSQSSPVSTFVSLKNSYALKMHFPSDCAEIAELAAERSYDVTLQWRGGPLAVDEIRIRGGGYTQETIVGNLRAPIGSVGTISISAAPTASSSRCRAIAGLIVCGDGIIEYDATSIRSQIAGKVFITARGVQRQVCEGGIAMRLTRG